MMIAVPANTQNNVGILFLSKGEKPLFKSKGEYALPYGYWAYLSQTLSIYRPQMPSIVFPNPQVQCFSCSATYASCLNQLLTSPQLQTGGSVRLSSWQNLPVSKCAFSIRWSYVLLDLTWLKSSTGDKYTVFRFMAMNGDEPELQLLELCLAFISLTKIKRTITMAYLPFKQA